MKKCISLGLLLSIALPGFANVYDKLDQLETAFYTNLATCTKGDFQSKFTYAWHIYGKENGRCRIENNSSAYTMKCTLPMDVAQKYSSKGLEEYQTARQKGFAKTDDFINSVNNNKNYCKIIFKQNK